MKLEMTKTSTNYVDYINLNNSPSLILNRSTDLIPYLESKYGELFDELKEMSSERQIYLTEAMTKGIKDHESGVVKEKILSEYENEFIERVETFNASILDIYYWSSNKKRLAANTIRTLLGKVKKHFDEQNLTKEYMCFSIYSYMIFETMRGKKEKQKQIRINPSEYIKLAKLYKNYAIKSPQFQLLALEMLTGRRMGEHKTTNFERVDIEKSAQYLSLHYGITIDRVKEFTWVKFTGQSKVWKHIDKRIEYYYIPLLYKIDFDEFMQLVRDFEETVKEANIKMGYSIDLWENGVGGLAKYRLITREIIGGRKKVDFPLTINKMHNFRAIYTVIMGNVLIANNTKFCETGQIYTLLLGHATEVGKFEYEIVKLEKETTNPINFKKLNESIEGYIDSQTRPTIKNRTDRKFYEMYLDKELIERFQAVDPDYNPVKYSENISKLRTVIKVIKAKAIEETGLSLLVLDNIANKKVSISDVIKIAKSYYKRFPEIEKVKRAKVVSKIVKTVMTMQKVED